jgi:hypothetical protein
MPIRINLLSEVLAAEDLRRRDPVKRAAIVGAFFVALSLAWYSSAWLDYYLKREALNSVEASIQVHDKEYAQIVDNKKKTTDAQGRLDALDNLKMLRFLQGNLLNVVQQTYVTNVQLTHMRVEQSSIQTPAVAGPKGHPASTKEHVVLRLTAKDYSTGAGEQVKVFKAAILDQLYFKNMLEPDGVRLASNPSQIETPSDGKPFVDFTLECRFRDRP